MNSSKIGFFEAVTLILSFVVAHTVLALPKALLDNTKSSTFLNIIYVSILAILFIYIVSIILKKFPGMDILDISETLGGKILKNIVGYIFILYFLVSSCVFLRNFAECLQIVYYPSTSISFILLFFIISILITTRLGFNANLKANIIIIPLVLISILFLFVANYRYFSFERIFPIFGNGVYDTFVSGIINIYSFSGIAVIYFLPPLLKKPEDFRKISIISLIVSAIYLILVISIILFMFPIFVNLDEVLPLYTIATYVEFGSFFQRLESVFLLIWMLAFTCYLSIIINFVIFIFKKITNIKHVKSMIYPFTIAALGIALIPKNYAVSKFYEVNIYPYLMFGLIFIFSFLVLFFAYLKKKIEH